GRRRRARRGTGGEDVDAGQHVPAELHARAPPAGGVPEAPRNRPRSGARLMATTETEPLIEAAAGALPERGARGRVRIPPPRRAGRARGLGGGAPEPHHQSGVGPRRAVVDGPRGAGPPAAVIESHRDELDVVDAQLEGAGAAVRVDLPLKADNLARRGDGGV